MPALAGIVNNEEVYLIDEIERSIHPIIIKEIISKISLDTSAKGQLIFTTHESCLLDQEILRPDEIWFAQKDVNGASKLYSLSDFNIHNTANIENGYLNGRYGGIPFLSNLQDLNWHKYEVSE
jgi:AAA15 family ATPase/GTPase